MQHPKPNGALGEHLTDDSSSWETLRYCSSLGQHLERLRFDSPLVTSDYFKKSPKPKALKTPPSFNWQLFESLNDGKKLRTSVTEKGDPFLFVLVCLPLIRHTYYIPHVKDQRILV